MRGRWQWTYRAKPGWHIVLTRCVGDPSKRWETELTSPEGRTRLYYHRTRRAARRHLRGFGIKIRRDR